jgi:TolB-like protein
LRVSAVNAATLKSVERTLVHGTGEPLPLPDKPSIAVLAFTNMSGDAEQEYFSDGIADDIITVLSRSHSLFVIARNSSFSYRGRSVDVKQVARELGVHYVVEGSVRRSGDRVRVVAQLIDAGTGNHVWAERYDREIADVFAVQDEITAAMTTAILPAVMKAEIRRVIRKPPKSLRAWEAYQRGLRHMGKGSAEDNGRAKQFFERAVALDPTFAPAYSGLAAHTSMTGQYTQPCHSPMRLSCQEIGRKRRSPSIQIARKHKAPWPTRRWWLAMQMGRRSICGWPKLSTRTYR